MIMSLVFRYAVITLAVAAVLLTDHHAVAEESDGERIVIYPGDYVVQSGDVGDDGAWRDGVSPTAVTISPGDVVVQKADVSSMGRWRIDVNPVSGTATATEVSDRIGRHEFEGRQAYEETKAEVSAHLNVSLIDCIDCPSPITATGTRTIQIVGTFEPAPPWTPAAMWSNPAIGWPSSPPSSGNVVTIFLPADWVLPGPFVAGQPFDVRFTVELDPVATFSVYVDVLGDLSEP